MRIETYKTDTAKNGQLRHKKQVTIRLSDYRNTNGKGIAYPRKKSIMRIASEKIRAAAFNLSEKEALTTYPYFHLLDSAVRLRAGLLDFKK